MAYKPSLRISITTTFDFGKFIERLESSKEFSSIVAKGAAKASQEAIKAGLSPQLRKVTTEIRKIRASGGNTPLLDTGKLYSSIKETKNGLTFKRYGQYQREGFTPTFKPVLTPKPWGRVTVNKLGFIVNPGNVTVPPRDFVRIGKVPKGALSKIIKKALRK